MRDRIDALGGTLTVTATPGGGACVEARIPALAALPVPAAVPVPRRG
jgi:signal transduction histidine kinase